MMDKTYFQEHEFANYWGIERLKYGKTFAFKREQNYVVLVERRLIDFEGLPKFRLWIERSGDED
jgi:hypothetical protein